MESRMRCWLLVLHRLATREEEWRLKRGRLSIIASISSLGSESMLGLVPPLALLVHGEELDAFTSTYRTLRWVIESKVGE